MSIDAARSQTGVVRDALNQGLDYVKLIKDSKGTKNQLGNRDAIARAGASVAAAAEDLIEAIGDANGKNVSAQTKSVQKIENAFGKGMITSLSCGLNRYWRRASDLTKFALFTLYTGAVVAATHYGLNFQHNTLPVAQEAIQEFCNQYGNFNFTGS